MLSLFNISVTHYELVTNINVLITCPHFPADAVELPVLDAMICVHCREHVSVSVLAPCVKVLFSTGSPLLRMTSNQMSIMPILKSLSSKIALICQNCFDIPNVLWSRCFLFLFLFGWPLSQNSRTRSPSKSQQKTKRLGG